jgi:hypothetical protein
MDEDRKHQYIIRHKNYETWGKSGRGSAGFWSCWLLRNKQTIKESYDNIKNDPYNYLSIIVLVIIL